MLNQSKFTSVEAKTSEEFSRNSLGNCLKLLNHRNDFIHLLCLQHEMIHAFLFLTQNNRDRDGHGPEFQFHMHRINRESGTNITVSTFIFVYN